MTPETTYIVFRIQKRHTLDSWYQVVKFCPMIQKAKRKNPGVYVLYGNFREQTIDTGFGA